jgi:hypothetical protein
MANKISSPSSFKFARFGLLVSALYALCASVVNISGQEWKSVADGVEYAEVRREFSGKPVNINLLRLDLIRVRLDVHHAMDAAIGTEKTSSIAARHKAFAAINAGFFRLDTSPFAGDPTGVFIVDGKVLSEHKDPRITLFISNQIRDTDHGPFLQETTVNFGYSTIFPAIEFGKSATQLIVSGLNRERKAFEVVVYTPEFGVRTPASDIPVLEVIDDRGRIKAVSITNGSTAIPPKGSVVVMDPGQADRFKNAINTRIELVGSSMRPPFEDAVAGVPQLIKNSKIDITWQQEKSSKAFVETRHPRTAVAKLKDGKFLMLTADGRSEQSAGLDLYDLAAYFLELGATDAMNLDGGGSTTMFLDGKVVNKPSDKEGERKVGDAILVTLRKPKKRN